MPKPIDISKKIKESIVDFEKLQYQIELNSSQKALALLMDRTFASSGAIRDSKNKKLKGYSEAYAKKREEAGYQTKNKDLQITGALMESIQVGESNGRPVLGFLTERSAKIAGYQEDQNKDTIFTLNESERQEVIEDSKQFAIEQIQNIVKSWY